MHAHMNRLTTGTFVDKSKHLNKYYDSDQTRHTTMRLLSIYQKDFIRKKTTKSFSHKFQQIITLAIFEKFTCNLLLIIPRFYLEIIYYTPESKTLYFIFRVYRISTEAHYKYSLWY